MPEWAIVSITRDWDIKNTVRGGTINITETAAAAPLLAYPEEVICISTVGRVFKFSL
jgi:hypothetical protein